MPADRLHLVRHGEVNNPDQILYGRLDGFGLTPRGHEMANLVADYFAGKPVRAVFASPLLRAQQTAEPIAHAAGLTVQTDSRLIEGTNVFEGTRVTARALMRNPAVWPKLVNPLRPSWGEAYREVAARMFEAMESAWDSVDGGDVVLVSHQLPIWMVHRSVMKQPLPHSPTTRRCGLCSVTSFDKSGEGWVETGYVEPAANLAVEAIDLGAV